MLLNQKITEDAKLVEGNLYPDRNIADNTNAIRPECSMESHWFAKNKLIT
jgi:hypothetical protein